MMSIRFHRNFEKQYRKLKNKEKKKFKQNTDIFLKDEFNPILNNHPLKGKYKGYRSFNVTGDIRAIYKQEIKGRVIFVAINKHSNLYE
jgi:addiction module RelE/StbE family toxin